jgi:hypothetical protein
VGTKALAGGLRTNSIANSASADMGRARVFVACLLRLGRETSADLTHLRSSNAHFLQQQLHLAQSGSCRHHHLRQDELLQGPCASGPLILVHERLMHCAEQARIEAGERHEHFRQNQIG